MTDPRPFNYPAGQAPKPRVVAEPRSGDAQAAPSKPVQPEAVFLEALRQRGLPQPKREFVFAHPRQFRADFGWPEQGVLAEVEGGIFTRQAHGSISGMLRDLEKYNLAATLGYRVVRCIPKDLCSEEFLNVLQNALRYRSP